MKVCIKAETIKIDYPVPDRCDGVWALDLSVDGGEAFFVRSLPAHGLIDNR